MHEKHRLDCGKKDLQNCNFKGKSTSFFTFDDGEGEVTELNQGKSKNMNNPQSRVNKSTKYLLYSTSNPVEKKKKMQVW